MTSGDEARPVARYARMFGAMGAEARLRIVQLLLTAHPRGLSAGSVQRELGIPASTLSHHLEKLKVRDLVRVRRDGTFLWYTANVEALEEVMDFLYSECCTRGQSLEPAGLVESRQAHGVELENPMDSETTKDVVKRKYSEAALRVSTGGSASCCAPQRAQEGCCDPVTSDLYGEEETGQLPQEAVLASLGCGNPTALAKLNPGETVLDLGSGGGIDVLLSAKRVGPAGKAYGLDMTDEMLALARENQRKAGVENAEFLKGEIEHIPLPDCSVDVVISNCVINLAADKDRVLCEAHRVLKPGGRFAVSDVVARGDVPPELRRSLELWAGCVAGALEEAEYRDKLRAAGFEDISIEPTRVYTADDARQFLAGAGIDADAVASQADGKLMSAFVRAKKPAAPRRA